MAYRHTNGRVNMTITCKKLIKMLYSIGKRASQVELTWQHDELLKRPVELTKGARQERESQPWAGHKFFDLQSAQRKQRSMLMQ